MKMLSFAHPRVVANPEEFLSSVKHKGSYTAERPECFSKWGLGLSSSKNNKKSTIKAVGMTHALYSLVFWCDAIALCEEHGKVCGKSCHRRQLSNLQLKYDVLKTHCTRFDDSDAKSLGFSHGVNDWQFWINGCQNGTIYYYYFFFFVNKWLKF